MAESEPERKTRAVQNVDAEVAKLFESLGLTEIERRFAEEHGQAVFKRIVGSYGERVRAQERLRAVAISAALGYAMIASEAFAKERGHH